MKSSEPSRTALMIARQRAAHQVLDHGSILDDPFAVKILGEDETHVLHFATGHALAGIGRLFTTARSRIEVDHPATQAWKRQRLAEAQLALPPWLVLVPVDFERAAWGETLVGTGFQQNSPAFFTWLGVVPYLTQDAIGSTLDYMASIQNSEVVFDYMEPPQAFSEELRGLVAKRTEQLEKIDERWASRFEPPDLAAILRSHGFCNIEDIDFQEIRSRFGRAVQGLAPGQAGLHVVHAKH